MQKTLLTFILFTQLAIAAPNHFISISDIHFDPYVSCVSLKSCRLIEKLTKTPISEWDRLLASANKTTQQLYGQDMSYPLLLSFINVLKEKNATYKPNFVLLLGDSLAHLFKQRFQAITTLDTQHYQRFVNKTLKFTAFKLKQAFPNVPIYPVVGNNDSYHEHYYTMPGGTFFPETATVWVDLLKNKVNKKQFVQSFSKLGYYVITPPQTHHSKIIVLNSNVFSIKAKGPSKQSLRKAANLQLDWFRQTLENAKKKHEKVWIAFHLPLGIDPYTTIKKGKIIPYWQDEFKTTFLTILERYALSDPHFIQGIFSGHIHADTFQLIGKNKSFYTFASLTPSISPVIGSNPGFKIYKFNDAFELTNFKVFYLNLLSSSLENWQEKYDFKKTYRLKQAANTSLFNYLQQLIKQPDFQHVQGKHAYIYRNNYHVAGLPVQPIMQMKNWLYYRCAIAHMTATDYKKCLQST